MLDVYRAIVVAERRGRALAQREWTGQSDTWLVDIADDADGHALMAASRAALRFGAQTRVRLGWPENPSPVWQALADGCLRLGAESVGGEVRNSLVIRDPDGMDRTVGAFPGGDMAWRVGLGESGPWVREVIPDDPVKDCAACREVDRRAIGEYGVPGIALMENAGVGATAVLLDMLTGAARQQAFIAVGGGNNGGDGLVMARGLSRVGVTVTVGLFKPEAELRGDAAINAALLRLIAPSVTIHPLHDDATLLGGLLRKADVIVDALLGTGFKGELSPMFRNAIEAINASGRPVLSLDLPSGMDGDSGSVADTAVRATRCVTFAAVKQGFVTDHAKPYCGRLLLADIGAPSGCFDDL
ncbi:MAG: NAD(P)H-hydrate epimerase [Planctomycetaceae bacterium]|nr:NAD(P)H-hydrate epimerase [Planctomycetaceae bacterium]